MNFMFAPDFLGPQEPWDDRERAQEDTVHTLCLRHNQVTPSLGNSQIIKDLQADLPNLCPQGRYYLY